MLRDEARQKEARPWSPRLRMGVIKLTKHREAAQRDGSREYAAGGTIVVLGAHNVTIALHPRMRLSMIYMCATKHRRLMKLLLAP